MSQSSRNCYARLTLLADQSVPRLAKATSIRYCGRGQSPNIFLAPFDPSFREQKMVRVKIQYIVALVLFAELVNSTGAQEAPWYVEPLWYARIEAEDETGLLMRCIEEELNGPPKHGDLCTSAPAVCYFGTQDCDGVGAHPEIMCVCDGGGMWQCDEEKMACPPFPDPARTGCAAPGEKIDHGNAAVCPEEDQGIFNLSYLLTEEYAAGTCGEPGTTCYYGSESWYV